MNLFKDETILMEGDYKQLTLTTHRIRQENRVWGSVCLVSIMLENVTSCEYVKKSKPMYLIVGILILGFALYIGGNGGGRETQNIAAGILLLGAGFIWIYFYTLKRGLFISSASAKIILDTKGMKYENIKLFIEKLEAAKNNRLINLK